MEIVTSLMHFGARRTTEHSNAWLMMEITSASTRSLLRPRIPGSRNHYHSSSAFFVYPWSCNFASTFEMESRSGCVESARRNVYPMTPSVLAIHLLHGNILGNIFLSSREVRRGADSVNYEFGILSITYCGVWSSPLAHEPLARL